MLLAARQRRSPADAAGRQRGLVDDERLRAASKRKLAEIDAATELLEHDAASRARRSPRSCGDPRSSGHDVVALRAESGAVLSRQAAEQVLNDVKYAGYIARQDGRGRPAAAPGREADPRKASTTPGSRTFAPKPARSSRASGRSNLAQASRISGITPADIALLMVHLEGKARRR